MPLGWQHHLVVISHEAPESLRACQDRLVLPGLRISVGAPQRLHEVRGPITLVTGKDRRVTLLECPSDDVCAMVDVAKVADLVLLLVDASFGFEMETFEFLAMLQAHGFPKVMGVLTKLDTLKTNKALRKTKQALKHRFWQETYQGAKLFALSGVVHGKYPKVEVRTLSLHLARVKFRPLVWRNTHPYIVCDRWEDLTPADERAAAAAAAGDGDGDGDVEIEMGDIYGR